MKRVKLIIFLACLICTIPSFSQDEYDRSLNDLEKINDAFIDAFGSFLESPYSHSNTLNVLDRIIQFNKIYKEIQSNKYDVLAKWDNYKVRLFYDKTDKMQAIANAFEVLLRPFAGYASAGNEGAEMEILLEPLFDEMGWEKRILNVTCPDAYFIEYSYGNFRMMFVKSTRPRDDDMNFRSHMIEVTFTLEGYGAGGVYNVGGNRYRMIQFKDDENVSYRKIVKATSVRK
jgi:hypothetical protein